MTDPTLKAPTGPRAMQGLSIKGRARQETNDRNYGGSANANAIPTLVVDDSERNKPRALIRHTVRSNSPRALSSVGTSGDLRNERTQSSSQYSERPLRVDRDELGKRDDKERYGKDASQARDARSTYPEEDNHSRSRSFTAAPQRSENPERHTNSSHRERSRTPEDRQRGHRDRSDSKSSSKHRRTSERSRRRDTSESDTGSTSESDDSEEEEEERRRKRKKRKEKERRREERDRDERRRRKKEKERRSSKDEKGKSKPTAASTGSWGKYGIISDSDLSRVAFEFRAWLVEERRLNPDTIPRDKQKKEFSVFVEDFNTATLPHEKYYNMAAHQAKMAIIRNGGIMAEEPKYDPRADEKAHVARLRASHLPDESDLTREEIVELRRLEKERIEAAKRRQLGLEVPKHLGVRMEEKQRELWQDPNLFHS